MPVTARLSGKFYERFGDDIANELVEWFNAVDSTYQTQLKEINDLNWARMEARSTFWIHEWIHSSLAWRRSSRGFVLKCSSGCLHSGSRRLSVDRSDAGSFRYLPPGLVGGRTGAAPARLRFHRRSGTSSPTNSATT